MDMVGLRCGANDSDGDGRFVLLLLLLLRVVEGVGCWRANAIVPKVVIAVVEVLDCAALVSDAAVT
jgi:hypothetical protein